MEGQGGPVDGADGRFNLWRWLCLNYSYNEPAASKHGEVTSHEWRYCTAYHVYQYHS